MSSAYFSCILGMSEAECDELQKQEDEAEDTKPVNILEALDKRYDQVGTEGTNTQNGALVQKYTMSRIMY